MYTPVIFTIFLLFLMFSLIFMIMHLIICISEHKMKVLCLNIQLVSSLNMSDELRLRYEYFCRDIHILKVRIMRCCGNHANSHGSNGFIL